MATVDEECSRAGEGRAGTFFHLPGVRHVAEGVTLLAELQDARTSLDVPFRVAACGLYNAGKSTLLNALTDQVDAAAFATGAARTTTASKAVRYGGVDYVDTPGLDATVQDDAEAWRALGDADLLLYVHDPQTGELHEAEVVFLSQLASLADEDGTLSDRLIVVLTHLDSWEDNMGDTASAVVQQVKARLGFAPMVFPVSSVAYCRGRKEGKLKLAEHSGVPALRDHLQARIAGHGAALRTRRRARVEDIRRRLLDAVDREIAIRGALLSEIKRRTETREQRRDEDFATVLKNIAARISRYRQRG